MKKINLTVLLITGATFAMAQTNTFPNSGNVGIGTSTPTHKLDVKGPGWFSNGSVLDIALTTPNGKNGIAFSASGYSNYSRFDMYNHDSNIGGNRYFRLRFNQDASGLTIRKGGNVGIGTANPDFKLHINSPDNQLMRLTSTNGTWFDFESTNAAVGSRVWSIGHIGTSNKFGIYQRDGTNQYRFVVDQNGKVGIGTSSPSEQLNVYSPTSGVLTRFATSANGGLSGLRIQGKTNDGSDTRFVDFFFDPETYTYGFGAGTNSGQLPINSGVSQADLVLDTDGNIQFKGTTTINGNKIRFSESRGIDYEPTLDAIFFNGYNNGQVAMLSDRDGNSWYNGNVGIGTTTTGSHKLAVEGTIGARGVKVEANGWSDFVFEDTYKLRSLEETEDYISENKHLPEIPNEAEVIENGIDLGGMDAKLLQKIEELTLYLIEQNKEIKALKAKVEILESK